MRVERGLMIPMGYGKFYRSESIVGLEPIEEGRGPGNRTNIYVEGRAEPVVASRSEGVILRDLTSSPREVTRVREQYNVLRDIEDSISEISPLLRSIIRDQGHWDLDRLEERIQEALQEDDND